MSALELVLRQPWMARLGWALVHFLWQGTAIAAAYAATRGIGGRFLSARGRYALACAALGAMAATPPVTYLAASAAATAPAGWRIAPGPAWEHALPWLVLVWVSGVALFSARLIGGWRVATRLRRVAVAPPPAEWREALAALMARMRVSAPVRLLASSLAPVPTVVGWLRPVILAPVEMLTGTPPEQIRALLAHELAHILRRDYLVNILQSVAEAALFYHPAVWWISERIRAEREACCDDLAVEATGDPLLYASALADLASRRRARLRLATAADGGSLVSRIRRLLGQDEPVSHSLPGFGAAWAMSLLWLAGLGAVMAQGAHSPAVARRAFVPPAATVAPLTLQVAPPPAVATPLARALLFDPFFAMPLPQTAPADADKQLASVSGVIMNTAGTPVSQAQVMLLPIAPMGPGAGSPQAVQSRSVASDTAGKFAFDKVPPGSYRLYITHPIYLNPETTPRVIALTASQQVDDISIKLLEPATVTGRAVDEDGDPVPHANAQVIRNAYSGGIRRFDVVARADSGDNGEFTITRVPAGRYIILVDNQPSWTATDRAPITAAKPGQKVYIPAGGYYGGLSRAPIDIAAGQTVPVGVIKMPNRLQLHVRGKVLGGDPAVLAGARVTRIQTAGGAIPWSYGADIRKDGSFDMSNMWPGSITIGVYSRNLGILGWTAITVGQEDLEGVTLSASAAPIGGVIHVEGAETSADPPKMPSRVTLTSMGALAVITVNGPVNADGSFTIPMAAPGLYSVELTGLPAGAYLKTMSFSRTPSPAQLIDWRGADSGALELGVSRKAATLQGNLVDGDGKPVAGTVTLVPVPPQPGIRRLYPTVKADDQGAFRFPSVTPGTYKVYGWEDIESSAHWDVDFIRPFESRGEAVQVDEGGSATVALKRISSAEMMDTLTKAGL